jgi:hypothetical protein
MKNLKDIQLPIFIELDCYNIKEVDDVSAGVKKIAEISGVSDITTLESVHHHPYYDNAAVIVFAVKVSANKSEPVVDFLKNVFENYYQNYPRFAEPVL